MKQGSLREIFSPSKELERGVTRRESCAQWALPPKAESEREVGLEASTGSVSDLCADRKPKTRWVEKDPQDSLLNDRKLV